MAKENHIYSSSAAAFKDRSTKDGKDSPIDSPKQLQDNEKDGQKAELDLNLFKIVADPSIMKNLLEITKTTEFMNIMNDQKQSKKLDNCNERKPEAKLFYNEVPFHLQVPAGVPMGRPRPSNPVRPPIIDISDDEECRGNKAPPLIQKNPVYVPPIDVCEENIPFLSLDRRKAEIKDDPGTSRLSGNQSHHSRQIKSNNNVRRRNCDNYNQEHKVTNLKSNRPHHSVRATSSQSTHSTLPQHVPQPSTHSTLPQHVPQPSTHSTLPQHVRQPSHSSSSNSKRLSHNQSHNSSHVENIYDKGLALSCAICKLIVSHHELLIAHYVKRHDKYDPPCGLSTKVLNVVKNTKLPEALGKKKTNIAWLDDFNWIPSLQYFEPAEKCKMIDCSFSTTWRKKLINHLQEHRDEVLAEPTTQPTVSSFMCVMCDFTTKDGSEFYEHCTGHTGEYMYGCGRCSRTAKNKTILKNHFKTDHDGLSMEIKSNDKGIPQGITYGYVCSACGFVQLNKARVEYHISQRHQSPRTAEIYKFDMSRPEEPKSVPNPPAPVDVLQPNRSDNARLNNVTRPQAASLISARNPQTHERRRAAPAKVRGDPRTALSRQDKLTQSISESNGGNSVSEVSSQRVVENLNNGSNCKDASLNLQTENRDNLRTTRNVTEQIELLKDPNEKQIVDQVIELPLPEDPNEKQTVDRAIEQIDLPVPEDPNEKQTVELLEEQNEDLRNEQFENLNEDLSVEFEAVIVKDEMESMTNPESHANGNSESSKDPITLFQAPTIDDTIFRLYAKLAPSTSTETTSTLSPASNSNIQSTSERDCDVQQKLSDWEERMKIIICSCSEMLSSSNEFYNHRQTRHTGERRVSCSECRIKFDTISLFTQHLWTICAKRSARIYSCKADSRCRFITSSKDQFVNHTTQKHSSLEWFSCYWCESAFATSISLTNHIKNCTRAIFLNNYFHSTIKNNSTSNPVPIVEQSNILKNQTHPPLNVVYRCSANDCSHQSLEREVFIHHFRNMHPKLLQEKLKCKYCGNYSNSFNELVTHLEEQHKDGANVQERTTYRFNLPAPANTEQQQFVTEKNINQVIMEKLNLENEEVECEPGVFPFVSAIEWGPEEESRVYKLISLKPMCQYVCLSFLVIKSSTFPQAELQQWRLDKSNFNQLATTDPVKHIEAIKSPAAIKSLNCEPKLRRLYKCCGRECIYTTDEATEFCEHLDRKHCSYQCVYCDFKLPVTGTTTELATHITNFHGSNCYQCPHCIYRSIKEHYVLIHIQIVHRHLGEKVKVLKCNNFRPTGSELSCDPESNVIPPSLLSIVRPISCGTGDCNFVCWDTVAFLNHHKSEHGEIQHIICYFCSLKVDTKENFAAHLKRHKVFDYHCEYCGEGDAQLNNVIIHSITMHPQWTGKVFIRPESFPSKVLKPLPPSTAIRISEEAPLHSASIALTSEIISERGDRNSLVSNGNVTSNSVLTCCYQLCRYSSKSLSDLKNHLRWCEFGQEGARLYCKPCFEPFAAEQQFVEHISTSHAIPKDPQENFSCGVCDFITTDIHAIKIHLFGVHNLKFKATTCEVLKDSSDNQNLRLFVYKPDPLKILISKSASRGFQSSSPSLSKKTLGDKKRVSNDCESASGGPVSSKDDEHDGGTFSSVRKNLIKHFERLDKCDATILNRIEINGTETANSRRSVSVENNSANIWKPSKSPIYLQPKERFRCPFKQCSHTSAHYGHLEAHIFVAHEDPFEIPCRYCEVIYNDMSDFHNHLKLHGPKLFKCWYCSYYNYFDNVVKGHILSVHGNLIQNVTEIRNESETTCEQPNSLNLAELSGNLACDCCNKFRCSSETSLRKHIIQCLSLENYTCNVCNEEFCKETDIELHFKHFHAELTPHFTVGLKPKVEMCLNTLVEDQIAKSRRQMHSPSISMSPPVRTQGTSSREIITSTADSSTANISTNSSSSPILSPQTKVAESITELISSTSLSNDKQKKRSCISKTSKSSADNITPTVTSSRIASDDDDLPELNLPCPMCPKSLKQISKFKTHLRQNHRVEAYKCSSCPNEHFISKDLAIKHQKAAHPDSNKALLKDFETEEFLNWVVKLLKVIGAETTNWPRPIALVCKRNNCVEKFTNLYLFKTHFIEHLRKSKKQSTSFKNVSTKKDYQAMCPFCDHIAAKRNMGEHVLLHYETMFYACPYCNTENRNKVELRKHINSKHPTQEVKIITKPPEPANLMLRECTSNFKRPVIIATQMEPTSSNDKEDYLCTKCAFSTSSINNIRHHCQNEHKPASCIAFGKGYSGPIDNIKRKAATSNSESVSTNDDDNTNDVDNNKKDSSSEPVPCKECDQVLNNMRDWLLHYRANHSEESNAALQQPKKKKRKLNQSAPDSLEDNGKDEEENQKLKDKVAAKKSNKKYSSAFECSCCDFVAVVFKNFDAHWNKEHRNRIIAYTLIKNIATYQCSSCPFKTPNAKEGRKHIRDMHCPTFACENCANMFLTEAAVRTHCHFKHIGEKHKISRKEFDPHKYQTLVDAMMESSDDKHSSSKEADKDKDASRNNDEEEDDDVDNVREAKKLKIGKKTNSGRAVRANCSTAAVVEKKFEPLRKERNKRRRIENMSLNIPEFSFYRNRSSSVTSYNRDRLMVHTNLKGYQNHTIPYNHLCEIFDINVRVSIMDMKHDDRYLKHLV